LIRATHKVGVVFDPYE